MTLIACVPAHLCITFTPARLANECGYIRKKDEGKRKKKGPGEEGDVPGPRQTGILGVDPFANRHQCVGV